MRSWQDANNKKKIAEAFGWLLSTGLILLVANESIKDKPDNEFRMKCLEYAVGAMAVAKYIEPKKY